jgi:hypothetical protein
MSSDTPRVRGIAFKAYAELANPVEGELRREPIANGDARCPRCGGRSWLLVERRAEPEWPFTRWRALACASCGAADGWGSGGRARPGRSRHMRGDPHQDLGAELRAEPTVDDVRKVASFRIVAASPSPTVRAQGRTGGRLTSVTLASGKVEVTTEIRWSLLHSLPRQAEPTPAEFAREELQDLCSDAHAPAGRREIMIEFDGQLVPFAFEEQGACWAAAAHLDDRTLTVAARDTRPGAVTLQTLR